MIVASYKNLVRYRKLTLSIILRIFLNFWIVLTFYFSKAIKLSQKVENSMELKDFPNRDTSVSLYSRYSLWVSGKLPPWKFTWKIPIHQTPPWKISPWKYQPRKFPSRIFPFMFLNTSNQVFLKFFVFSLLSPLSLILLKRLLCNSMF